MLAFNGVWRTAGIRDTAVNSACINTAEVTLLVPYHVRTMYY